MPDELTAEAGATRASSLSADEQRAQLAEGLGGLVARALDSGEVDASMSDEAVRDAVRWFLHLCVGDLDADGAFRCYPTWQDAGPEFLQDFERMTREELFGLADAHCAELRAAYSDLEQSDLNDSERETLADAQARLTRRRLHVDRERAELGLSKFSEAQPEPDGPVEKPRSRETRARGPPVGEEEDDDDPHEVEPRGIRFHWQRAIADSALASTHKLVAHTVALGMHPDGTNAYWSVKKLAKRASLHVSTVRPVLGELVRGGWLIADARPGRATIYAAGFPQGVAQDDPSPTATPGVAHGEGWGRPGRPEVEVEVEPEVEPPHTAPDGAAVEWQSVRRDRCRSCERFLQVDGEGLCTDCWREERAA
jgi:hypothetical protein